MIFVILFDAFFTAAAIWAAWRLVETARTDAVTWRRTKFARSESSAAFWSVTIFNVAVIAGAIYGIALGFGL